MTTRVFGAVAPDATEVFLTNGNSVESALASVSSGINVYNTYTELQQDVGSAGQVVHARGRDSIGDLGGGFFEWLSGNESANVTADPLKVLYVPPASDTTGASGVWYRLNNGTYYTSWAGLGDGTDQATLFADIAAQMGDYETWVFNKDFTTSSNVTISGKTNLVIKGKNCVITETGTVGNTFQLTNCIRSEIHGFRVFGDETEDNFDYSQAIGPSYYFIRLLSCDDCLVDSVVISGKSAGFFIDAGSGNVIIRSKHVGIFTTPPTLETKVNGVNSFFIKAGSNNAVESCVSIRAGTGLITGSNAKRARFINNYILEDSDNSIYISSGEEVLCKGNYCDRSRRGSGIKNRANDSIVTENTIVSCILGITLTGENGVDPDNYGANGNRSIVSKNMIISCDFGINIDALPDEVTGALEFCRDCIITDNQLVSCGGPDFLGSTDNSAPIRIVGGFGHKITGNFINGKKDAAVTKGIFIFTIEGIGKYGYDISNNTFRGNWDNCIYAYGISDSIISYNKSISDTVGRLVYLLESNDNLITGNYTKTGEAVRLSNCVNNIISYNKGQSNFLREFLEDNALYGNIPTGNSAINVTLSLDTWRTPNPNQQTLVTISCRAYSAGDGVNPGELFLDVDESGGTITDYSFLAALASAQASTAFSVTSTFSFIVPAGGSYRVRNERDPDNLNTVTECVESFI